MLNRRRNGADGHALETAAADAAAPGGPLEASKSYHHGNLREALIDAALELVRERGPDAFTLREVARRAGVSHAAPYRHFSDRAALLAAAAERTYAALVTEITQAAGDESTPRAALRAAALAYVRFAVDHPTGFRLLFQPEVRAGEKLDRGSGGGDVFECLASAVARAQHAGELRAGNDAELALAALAMMHGLSCLAVDGGLPPASAAPGELAQRLFDVLTSGLAP